MKTKLLLLLFVFALLFTAAGCSGEKKPVNASTESTSRQTAGESTDRTETSARQTSKAETTAAERATETSAPASTEKETEAALPESTSAPTAKPKKQSDKFTIKLYTDKNSKSYKSLKKPEMSLKTDIGGVYSDEYMRFVCNADGVEVTLVELSFNDFRGEFDEGEPVFSVITKKGAVYEFKAYLGETMPPAKLKAKKGGYGAEFVLQMNGKDARTDFSIKGAKTPK